MCRDSAKEKKQGETDISSENQSSDIESVRTVELLRVKSHVWSECRQNMKKALLSLRPDGNEKCKLRSW